MGLSRLDPQYQILWGFLESYDSTCACARCSLVNSSLHPRGRFAIEFRTVHAFETNRYRQSPPRQPHGLISPLSQPRIHLKS